MIKNMEEVIEQVRSYLPEYLASFGREATGRKKTFTCPNESFHKNGDRNPSAGLVPKNKELWNCFACGEKGDIFLAAKYLEGMEIRGQGFLNTVTELAQRYSVQVEENDDATEIVNAYEYVASVIKKGFAFPAVNEYIQQRNFTDVADEFGFGYVNTSKLYTMLKTRYEADFIQRNELCSDNLFKDRLIFPLQDDAGHVIGFAGRTITGDKRKYINSSNSIIFQKSKYLYNLNRIKGDHVYVVEGYADVWRCHQVGIEAVAACGTAFTEEHLNLLMRCGIKKVTFVFDGDDAGRKATERTVKILENCLQLECAYITLPNKAGEKDADEYISKYGKEGFLELEPTVLAEPKRKKKEQFLDRLVVLEDKFLSGEATGYKTGFGLYDRYMENVQPGLHLVGGISNIGKTAWMTDVALRLATGNPDLFVLYVSIDDDLNSQVPRMVAKLGSIPVNQAKNPKMFIDNNVNLTAAEKEIQWKRRAMGNNHLVKLAQNNFAMIDINDASRLDEIEREVQLFKEITGKPVALFLDNFHKVRTKAFPNFKERFTHVSEELKRITIQNELITFSTVELTKLGHDGRPGIESIKETVDIIYDAQTIHMLHQDMHSKQGQTELKFSDGRFPGREFPILEVNVVKNKLSGWKGMLYYKFYQDFMHFEECYGDEQTKYRKVQV